MESIIVHVLMNTVPFMTTQVETIRTGMNLGMTMVIGLPCTGIPYRWFFQCLYISLISQICILFVKIATSNTLFAHVTDSITYTQFAKLLFVKSIFLDIHEI